MLLVWLRLKWSEDFSSGQFRFAKVISGEANFFRRALQISTEDSAQVGMGNGVAQAIRSKMKTAHPLRFLAAQNFHMSRNIDRGRFENPGPEMDLVVIERWSNRLADSGGGPRQRGSHA